MVHTAVEYFLVIPLSYSTTWLQFPLSPLFPGLPFFLSPKFTPFLFLFRKERASQGYQPNTEKQVTLSLGTNSPVKTGQGNLVRGKGLQEQAKESETSSTSTVRTPIRTPKLYNHSIYTAGVRWEVEGESTRRVTAIWEHFWRGAMQKPSAVQTRWNLWGWP